MKSAKFSKIFNIIDLGLICIAIDQISKWWVLKSYPFLIYKNFGVLFGYIHQPIVKVIIIIAGLAILIWVTAKSDLDKFIVRFSLALIYGGAISNLLDRWARGHVIDFINLGFWPTFNIADVFIFIGVIIYAYQMMKSKKTLNGLFS